MDWKAARESMAPQDFTRLVFQRQREGFALIQKERDEYLATASEGELMRDFLDMLDFAAWALPKTPAEWELYDREEGSLATFKRRIEACRERKRAWTNHAD